MHEILKYSKAKTQFANTGNAVLRIKLKPKTMFHALKGGQEVSLCSANIADDFDKLMEPKLPIITITAIVTISRYPLSILNNRQL